MKSSTNINSAAISRRTLLAASIAAGAAPLLLATRANATVKVSQAAVHFNTAANTDRNCGACRHYSPLQLPVRRRDHLFGVLVLDLDQQARLTALRQDIPPCDGRCHAAGGLLFHKRDTFFL